MYIHKYVHTYIHVRTYIEEQFTHHLQKEVNVWPFEYVELNRTVINCYLQQTKRRAEIEQLWLWWYEFTQECSITSLWQL